MTLALIAFLTAAVLSLGYWVNVLHRRLATAQAELSTVQQGQIVWLRRSPVRMAALGR
jgi:hypothetical protein